MRYLFKAVFILSILYMEKLAAQRDTIDTDSLSSKRFWTVNTFLAGTTFGSHSALYFIWYKNEQLEPFHFFNDCSNWLQMDKVGHGFTAYHLNRISSDMYRWSGVHRDKATLIGLGFSMTYLGILELMDGFSSGWGFSGCDVLANLFGSTLYSGQELLFKRQFIIPKFSFSRSPYAAYRPEVLGSTFSEELLKDYNGQTYWMSFSPFGFSKKTAFLNWLCLSVGYSSDQQLVGNSSSYEYMENGEIKTFHATRQWLFSLDIDLSRIPVKKEWLKKTLKQLNLVKIPFPTFTINPSSQSFHWLYF
jgi:hypothetical protein